MRFKLGVLFAFLAFSASTLAGCSGFHPSLPQGPKAYSRIPAPSDTDTTRDYRIGPLDTLSITVFQEPDLSFEELPVDASGNITMPLIGSVQAAGRTSNKLARELASRLNDKYLVDAQVSVVVKSSVSQHVTIEGSVNEPGIYQINGSSTLLQALAVAKSPTRVAKLDQVVVFRNIDGQRMGAVFNVNDIRNGTVPDPEILGGDVVVVGFSGLKGAFRDVLSAAPIFNVFRSF